MKFKDNLPSISLYIMGGTSFIVGILLNNPIAIGGGGVIAICGICISFLREYSEGLGGDELKQVNNIGGLPGQ